MYLCINFVSANNGKIVNGYAWGENVGWVKFSTDENFVTIQDNILVGFAWDSIFGWLNLSPNNGGVKNDGKGNLTGFAWSQNGGWVDFSGVKINKNGKFQGTASGPIYGRLSFDCEECNVTIDWKYLSSSTPSTNKNGSIITATPIDSIDQNNNKEISSSSNSILNFNFSKTLKLGSKGIEVSNLQILLKRLGYFHYTEITDYFGSITKAAVVDFQKIYNIDPIGIVGPQTRSKLNKLIVKDLNDNKLTNIHTNNNFSRDLKEGMIGNDVMQLQKLLIDLGYNIPEGPTDYFGKQTLKALINYQINNNIKPSIGYFGPITKEKITSE